VFEGDRPIALVVRAEPDAGADRAHARTRAPQHHRRDVGDRRREMRKEEILAGMLDLLIDGVLDEVRRRRAGLEGHSCAGAVRRRQHPARRDQRARAETLADGALANRREAALWLPALDGRLMLSGLFGIQIVASHRQDADEPASSNEIWFEPSR